MMDNTSSQLPIKPPSILAVFADALVAGHQNVAGFDSEVLQELVPLLQSDRSVHEEFRYMPPRLFDPVSGQLRGIAKPDGRAHGVVQGYQSDVAVRSVETDRRTVFLRQGAHLLKGTQLADVSVSRPDAGRWQPARFCEQG